MDKQRGGYIFDIFAAGSIGNVTKSIGRATNIIDAVRMKALGHLGVNFDAKYFGDTLTWDELSSAGVTWGNSTTLKYAELKDGWLYEYEANGKIFTVTDDKGIVIKESVTTLSNLGICLDIMSSHQFTIYFSAYFINDAFLIAWKYKNGSNNYDGCRKTILNENIKLAYVDKYFTDDLLHWKCNRVTNCSDNISPNLKNKLIQALLSPTKQPSILRPKNRVLLTNGDYSELMITIDTSSIPAESNKKRNAIIDVVMADLFMIAYFASLMNMSKPVYEPWMLFGMWKWLCSSDPVLSIEKIFDLSPRW